MNRQAQSAVLFLLGASLLHAATTDLYLRYVKQGLRPLVLVAGAVLIAAAVATVWYERKRARREKEAPHRGSHTHPEPRVSWLLVLPLLALILVAPPALGSYSATRT
ncbi:TIGR03943 family protein, partial [Streptomyces muensis]|nr:TIGR03943 family protein [Streptomyces muensis]